MFVAALEWINRTVPVDRFHSVIESSQLPWSLIDIKEPEYEVFGPNDFVCVVLRRNLSLWSIHCSAMMPRTVKDRSVWSWAFYRIFGLTCKSARFGTNSQCAGNFPTPRQPTPCIPGMARARRSRFCLLGHCRNDSRARRQGPFS